MNIAITGASGFIGKVLVPQLLSQAHSLRLLTRKPGAQQEHGIRYIYGDLLQEESLKELVQGADAVIHLAAMISIDDSTDQQAYDVNTKSTTLLLAASKAAGVKRFIYVSSVTAFNQAPYDERMDETRPPTTAIQNGYDTSKAMTQALALAYNNEDFEVLVLAPTAVVGPYDERPSLIGKAITGIYTGKVPALFPGGVDFVDVRDVAGAIASALTMGTPGHAYLLSGRWASLGELGTQIGNVKGKRIRLPILPLWLVFGMLPLVKMWSKITGGPPYYTRQSVYNLIYSNKKIDHTKATTQLQFHPRPFSETIQDTIDWFRKNGFLK